MKNTTKAFLIVGMIFNIIFGLLIGTAVLQDLLDFILYFVQYGYGTVSSAISAFIREGFSLFWGTFFLCKKLCSVIICPLSIVVLSKATKRQQLVTLGAINLFFGSLVGGILMLSIRNHHLNQE